MKLKNLGIVASMLIAVSANAQTQVPNDFQASTPARAAEVNQNFDALESAIDGNGADISTNAASIESNETGIQSLSTAVVALGGSNGLTVLFKASNDPASHCAFVHITSDRHFWWNPTGFAVHANSTRTSSGSFTILFDVQGEDNARATLLDLMIRIGNLDLAVDDFRDSLTNEYVCTNEKLLSLL